MPRARYTTRANDHADHHRTCHNGAPVLCVRACVNDGDCVLEQAIWRQLMQRRLGDQFHLIPDNFDYKYVSV